MNPSSSAHVLRPAVLGQEAEEKRRHGALRRGGLSVLGAVLAHLLVVGAFYLIDRFAVQDIALWDGPVSVKIGVPDAPDSPAPQPPIPESLQESLPEVPLADVTPIEQETPVIEDSSPAPTTSPEVDASNTEVAPTENGEVRPQIASDSVDPSAPTSPPQTAAPVVRGEEQGNSYLLDFDGAEGDVGRAGAYEYISNYFPLPESLPRDAVEQAQEYLGMSVQAVQSEIERYWEPLFESYVKKPGREGDIPLSQRPQFWSLLMHSLNLDSLELRGDYVRVPPVTVEFTVGPSQGAQGAELSDFSITKSSYNERIDEAVVYGLSRWVYYNDGEDSVRGRITYEFGQP